MDSTRDVIVCQSWLWKASPGKLCCLPKKWNPRWFILKSYNFPDHFVLEYHDDTSSRNTKKIISLDDCKQICAPRYLMDRHDRFPFIVKTANRTYCLSAYSESVRNKWVKALYQVCGFIMTDKTLAEIVYSKPITGRSTRMPIKDCNEKDRKAASGILSADMSHLAIPTMEFDSKPKALNLEPDNISDDDEKDNRAMYNSLRQAGIWADEREERLKPTKARYFSPRPEKRSPSIHEISIDVMVHGEPVECKDTTSKEDGKITKGLEMTQVKNSGAQGSSSTDGKTSPGNWENFDELRKRFMEMGITDFGNVYEGTFEGKTLPDYRNVNEENEEEENETFV